MHHGKYIPLYVLIVFVGMLIFIGILVHFAPLEVLFPTGSIALQERNLMVIVIALMSLLAFPTIGFMFYIAWRYRADNPHHPSFAPEHTGSKKMVVILWGIPTIAVLVLACIIWPAAHMLDPYKAISNGTKPVTIQVVALRWKWLFIYPEEHIATVNYIQFPQHTPVNFYLTADAPMNSFWIPGLGGQIYAMQGMQTQTHFLSEKTGEFTGKASEINGEGYADMHFDVKVTSEEEYQNWLNTIKQNNHPFLFADYQVLSKPELITTHAFYSSVDPNLYDTILMKDMMPTPTPGGMDNMNMQGMDMEK